MCIRDRRRFGRHPRCDVRVTVVGRESQGIHTAHRLADRGFGHTGTATSTAADCDCFFCLTVFEISSSGSGRRWVRRTGYGDTQSYEHACRACDTHDECSGSRCQCRRSTAYRSGRPRLIVLGIYPGRADVSPTQSACAAAAIGNYARCFAPESGADQQPGHPAVQAGATAAATTTRAA